MKEKFTDGQIADLLRKSYFVVDGLWFVKTEETRGFDEAMELDEAVWSIMSKVQARKARQALGITGNSLDDLAKAFQLKLAAEGHEYDVNATDEEVELTIRTCPWYEILKSSERTHIAETIADRICARELSGWVSEFGPGIEFRIIGRLCVESDRCEVCRVVFRKTR